MGEFDSKSSNVGKPRVKVTCRTKTAFFHLCPKEITVSFPSLSLCQPAASTLQINGAAQSTVMVQWTVPIGALTWRSFGHRENGSFGWGGVEGLRYYYISRVGARGHIWSVGYGWSKIFHQNSLSIENWTFEWMKFSMENFNLFKSKTNTISPSYTHTYTHTLTFRLLAEKLKFSVKNNPFFWSAVPLAKLPHADST